MRFAVILLVLLLALQNIPAQTDPDVEAAQESIIEGLFDDYSQDDLLTRMCLKSIT